MASTTTHNGVLKLRPLGSSQTQAETRKVFEHPRLTVLQLTLPASIDLEQRTPGDLVLHCLKGRARVKTADQVHDLEQNQLLFVPAHQPYALHGVEDSSLLMSIALIEENVPSEIDVASENSFPASDAPGWTGVTGP